MQSPDYTRRQIKNDQPGSYDFGDFSVNIDPISLKFYSGKKIVKFTERLGFE